MAVETPLVAVGHTKTTLLKKLIQTQTTMKLHKQFLIFFFLYSLCACTDEYSESQKIIDFTEDISILNLLTEEDKSYFSSDEISEMQNLANEIEQSNTLRKSKNAIYIKAGSVNKIQDAIHSVPDGGMVILNKGTHYSSGTIHIHDKKVRIMGIGKTELIVDTEASTSNGYVQSAIHMKNADKSSVINIDIKPTGDIGGTGIFIQNSDKAIVYFSSIIDHEFGIMVEQSDMTRIYHNRIIGHPRWIASNLAEEVYGIMIVNGKKASIIGNKISNTIFGSWLCDEDGRYFGNKTEGNFIGSILCNIPKYIPLKNGDIIGSDKPATNWVSMSNTSNNNFYTGYSITDGSSGNLLNRNSSSGNAAYDIEVMGDTNFFGFFTPTAKNNRIHLSKGQLIKDCAENTSILRMNKGTIVDTATDSCPN